MMNKLKHLLDLSIVTLDDTTSSDQRGAAYKHRQSEIAALCNPFIRLGAATVHQLVGLAPAISESAYERLVAREGLYFLGRGGEADVYLSQDYTVTKSYRNTRDMSSARQHKFMEEHIRISTKLRNNLGPVVLDQTYTIGQDPVHGVLAVLGTQKFVKFSSKNAVFSYPDNHRVVTPARIERLESLFPGVARELNSFAARSLSTYDEVGCLPDVFGPNNLVVGTLDSEPGLHLIDGVGHSNYRHLAACTYIVGQLASLQEATASFN